MQSRVLLRAIADIVTQGGFRLRTRSKGAIGVRHWLILLMAFAILSEQIFLAHHIPPLARYASLMFSS